MGEQLESSDYVNLRRRVDELEVRAAEKTRPWYKQISTLVSVVAVFLSIITGIFSWRFQSTTDIRAKKTELREIVIKLIDLNGAAAKILRDQKVSDPIQYGTLSQEAIILLQEAQNTLEQLPPRDLLPSELVVMAMASLQNGEQSRGFAYLKTAIRVSKTPRDKIVTESMLAASYMIPGIEQNMDEANRLFTEAVGCRTPAVNCQEPKDYSELAAIAQAYSMWGAGEAENGFASDGKVKLDYAQVLCAKIPAGIPGTCSMLGSDSSQFGQLSPMR